MAEDKEEELSMEDILSSIKDILLDDNAEQQKTQKVAPSVSVSSPENEPETDVLDDILTLSPSMIVEPDPTDDVSFAQPEILAEEGADPLEPDLEQRIKSFSAETVSNSLAKDDSAFAGIEDEPLDLTDFAVRDNEDISLETDPLDVEDILPDLSFDENEVDTESEPIFSQEDDVSRRESFALPEEEDDVPSLDSLIDDDTLNAILEAQPEEPELSEVGEVDFLEPTDNVYGNKVAETIIQEPEIKEAEFEEIVPEPVFAPEPVFEQETLITREPEIVKETEAVSEDEAVDISANIISNFAKMFAEQQKPKTEDNEQIKQELTAQTMAEIELGEGSLTIEAIVRDVVTDIVDKNLSENFDFAAVATQEIAHQTKSWLSANLPTIVETAVKKEIERVMAKVGS